MPAAGSSTGSRSSSCSLLSTDFVCSPAISDRLGGTMRLGSLEHRAASFMLAFASGGGLATAIICSGLTRWFGLGLALACSALGVRRVLPVEHRESALARGRLPPGTRLPWFGHIPFPSHLFEEAL
jgi:hypothetical protein